MAIRRRFQYETLLRIRKRQEDLKAQALAAARREVHAAEGQRARIAQEQRRVVERAGGLLKERFDAAELRCYYQYERYLSWLGDAKDAEIRTLEEVAETKRAELEEATKSRRMVEKLKERHIKAHAKQVQKDEQRLTDEVGTTHAALGLHGPVWPAPQESISGRRNERELET